MNNISFSGLTKKQYQYGSCVPISDLIYKRLKKKGYNPKIVVGWVEVLDGLDILPDKEFIKIFKNWWAITLPHTWIEVNNHRIDITKNQFNIYGGIYRYYPAYIDIPNTDKEGRENHIIKKYKNALDKIDNI
jgi:hypothetical protein